MYVILLGLPGAGKGTQAARLAVETSLVHVTTGELFRENIRNGTELGNKAKPFVESGNLVPDEITIGMLLDRISRPDCENGVLFDGFPRNTDQAAALDRAVEAEGKRIGAAIYIKVDTDELVHRLAGRWNCKECGAVYHETNQPPRVDNKCDRCGSGLYQRDDDKPDVVRTRLEVNLAQLEPLLAHYSAQGKLQEVEGQREMHEVTADLAKLIAGN